MKTYRISTPRLQTTPCQFYPIMLYFFLALLLLAITHDKCDTSITPPLGFTSLSKANNTFVSIQHMTNSLPYSPIYHCPEIIVFNQCHCSFIGPMTQQSFIGPMTQPSFIGPMTRQSFIGPLTQQSFIGPMTQHLL